MHAAPRLTVVGHSTVLVEMDGVRILTDPVLRDRVGPLRRHGPSVAPEVLERVDAVVVSHLHWDHFDARSFGRLARDVPVFVPVGAAAHARRRGVHGAEELTAGAEARVGPLVVRATPAAHSGFRPPLGPQAEASGFLIGGSRRVYFAGDTALFGEMREIEDRLDLALLPVWGWGPRLGPGHMDPAAAVASLTLLRPRVAVPIHWGTFWPIGMGRLAGDRRTAPPEEFAQLAARGRPGTEVLVMPDGRSILLPA